ncbi:unnamed protein product [Acanthoscelides obtectus]|uniref:Uncharacterized protein n=1 Tax=Acanthoscelides obtectus TaxID=200917 RepID=A0A9P0LPZ8_ACAOB|nr:unnamed protein product [Acanthoscelides obtectus]CAK1672140.1 hypothetical protein AOBTE_LOCUS28674 [Acanthoscelides obtectus]
MVNRKTQKHNSTKTTLDPQKSMERVRSGESLYKTFTFAQSLNDEDTEKCIAFWKSVMEKHLEPVKCHIVENREYQPAENFKEATYENEKNCEPEKKNEKLDTKSRCPMCQTLNTPFEENICGNPNYTEKEIKDLNKWKSTSRKKTYATGTSGSRFVSRNQQEKKIRNQNRYQF